MNLLELQQRANVLVEKANAYEDSLQGVTWDEQEIINQHKYTDIYSLRPIMKLLFGSSISEKTNRTLDNDVALRVFASTAPMWNSSFNLLSYKKEIVPITDFASYSLYYGVDKSSPNITWSSSNGFTIPSGLIFKSPQNTFTLTNDVKIKTSTGSYLGYIILIYKTSTGTYDYASVGKRIIFSDTRPALPSNIELGLYWFDTSISQWKILYYNGKIDVYPNATVALIASKTVNGEFETCYTEGLDYDSGNSQSVDYKSDQHEFMNDIHNYNNSNLITLDVKQNTLTDRNTRIKQGINYSYSANIMDALVTESQVTNVFKWNTTTSQDIKNNTITTSRQVPGIVCYYLGNDYNGEYTATIPYNPGVTKLNQINYSTPPSYGAFYTTDPTTSQVPIKQGVLEEDTGHEACRIFIPSMHFTRGKLESPQQIWQPDMKFGDSNTGLGYNWQGQALYHELVFKNRRSGSKKANVDFIPTLDSIPDNDPQGLATRFALAQQKKYYKNRPWFNELDELVNLDPTRLQKIIENNSYITTSGSFDKSKFTVVGSDYGTLSDDGILTSTSANLGYITSDDTLTGITLENNNSITILSPIYTINQKSKASVIFSGNFTDGTRFGTYSIYFDALNESATFRSQFGSSAEQSIQLFTQFNTDDKFQFKITLSLNSGALTESIQYKVNSENWIDKGSIDIVVDTSLSLKSFTRIGGLPANTTDVKPLSIVDQDDTVLFSAQSEASKTYMTDEQFYNQFKLDYDMFARAFNLPQ